MTWKEFKEKVEAEGVKEWNTVHYIDIGWDPEKIDIHWEERWEVRGVVIT